MSDKEPDIDEKLHAALWDDFSQLEDFLQEEGVWSPETKEKAEALHARLHAWFEEQPEEAETMADYHLRQSVSLVLFGWEQRQK